MLALVVWGVVVAVPAVRTYGELRAVARQGKRAAVTVGAFHGTVLAENFLPFAVNAAVVTHAHAITAMELPGALVEMPVAIALTNPSLWYPRRLDVWTGSLVAMPVYGLPAWWLAGLGLEGLVGRRRLRWPLLVLGSAIWGMMVFLLCGYVAGWTVPGHAAQGWVVAGFGLWIGLLGVLPATWGPAVPRSGGPARTARDKGRRAGVEGEGGEGVRRYERSVIVGRAGSSLSIESAEGGDTAVVAPIRHRMRDDVRRFLLGRRSCSGWWKHKGGGCW